MNTNPAETEALRAATLAAKALASWRKGKAASRRANPEWEHLMVRFRSGEAENAARELVRAVKRHHWVRFKAPLESFPPGSGVVNVKCRSVKVRAAYQYFIMDDETKFLLDAVGAPA